MTERLLELRHLRMLVALAETGSVSRAAQRVHLTQSAVSHQLRALGERYGMPLVRRSWVRNMVPNLPAPITATVTGRPAASRSRSFVWRFKRYSVADARRKRHRQVERSAAGLGRSLPFHDRS